MVFAFLSFLDYLIYSTLTKMIPGSVSYRLATLQRVWRGKIFRSLLFGSFTVYGLGGECGGASLQIFHTILMLSWAQVLQITRGMACLILHRENHAFCYHFHHTKGILKLLKFFANGNFLLLRNLFCIRGRNKFCVLILFYLQRLCHVWATPICGSRIKSGMTPSGICVSII